MKLFDHLESYKNNLLFFEEDNIFFYHHIFSFEKKLKFFEKDKLVLFICENSSEFLLTYISLIRKDLKVMLVDYNLGIKETEEIIKAYKPYYLFINKNSSLKVKEYDVKLKLNKNIILQIKKHENYKIFDELNLLLSTSGTTGSKKFVRISKKNLYSNTEIISKYLNIKSDDVVITTLPPHYTYGLSILNSHIFSGAAICINNSSFIDKSFWNKAKKHKITNFGGVPFNFEILKKLNFTKLKIPTLKYITQAGGHLDEEVKRYFLNDAKKNNYKFIVMYGQVEATSRISYVPFEKLEEKFKSAGKSIPGGKLSICPENDEIIYQGPNVCLGYAHSFKDLEKGDENKLKLRTGDLGSMDSDGYIFISGRKNREAKLFGHRVNLDEIEKILNDQGYKCLCISKKNKLYIFNLNKNNNDDIVDYLKKKIKINSNFLILKKLDTPPISSSGKIIYSHLEKFI